MTYLYEEVLDRIENARRFGNLPGVEVSRAMLHRLGEPQKGMPYVHIAGTNGKGSVCAFLSSILKEAGYKVGVFTSPHLVDFRERITVNGEMIPKETVTRIGNRLLAEDFGVSPTMFDYCLAMAVLYFKEQQCDIAVMETGLGGKLDSTNALGIPDVAIITRIGYDHMAILGNTLSEIAGEKAGIIKKGSYIVSERQEPEAEAVIKRAARACKYYELNEMDVKSASELEMQLLGVHQWENAAAAVKAAEFLLKDKSDRKQVIQEGIALAKWPGRMEILSKEPFLMVDGAHNGHGVAALKESLLMLYPGEKFHFIMGVMADKDYENMVSELLPLAEDFITVTPESERALQAERLASFIRKKGIHTECATSVEDALKLWKERTKKETNVDKKRKTVAFGSLYFIGEIEAMNDKIGKL